MKGVPPPKTVRTGPPRPDQYTKPDWSNGYPGNKRLQRGLKPKVYPD